MTDVTQKFSVAGQGARYQVAGALIAKKSAEIRFNVKTRRR